MKAKRRIVLVSASTRSALKQEDVAFIQSTTHNNLGEVYKLGAKGFMLSFGARKTRESDIERSLLVCLAIRDQIDGIKFGVSYSLASITEKKTGTLKIEGNITKKVEHLRRIATYDQISTDDSISKIYSRIFDIRPLKVKGKDVLNVFGFKDTPSRIRGLREAYGKLIGRDKEFDELKKLIYQIAADQGQIVGVSGEAGIGKTRFTHELKTVLKLRGINFYEGTFPYFGGSTYKGYKDIISKIANIKPDDSVQNIDKKLLRIGRKYSLEITDVNFLTNLYSLVPVSDTLKHLGEEQIKVGTFVAIKKLIFAIAEDPLVIILEDMQNADALSTELANFLAEGLPEKKLLFFMNYRPEFAAEFEKKIYFNPIKLKRFEEKQARDFLESLLDTSFIPKKLLRLILKKSAGNPLYMEELIRSLLDKGKIKIVANDLQLTEGIVTDDIQPTVHGVISYRMEKLSPGARNVLKWASVSGDEIDIKMLKNIAGKDISKDIETLEVRDFIVEKSIYPEEIYRFRHDLIREVAYESISTPTRKSIHLKIGNYLEKKYKREIEENIEELANHFVESTDKKKGFDYAIRAADKLKANYSNEEAIRLYLTAIKLADKSNAPKSSKNKKLIIEKLVDIYLLIGHFKDAEEILLSYKNLTQSSDTSKRLDYLFLEGRYLQRKGEFSKAIENFHKIINSTNKADKERKIRFKTLTLLISLYGFTDELLKAREYAELALRETSPKDHNDIALLYERLAYSDYRMGRYPTAIQNFAKAIKICMDHNFLHLLPSIYANLANTFYYSKNYNSAYKYYNLSISISEQIGNVSNLGLGYMNIGVLYEEEGKITKSLKFLKKAEEILIQNNQVPFLVMIFSNLSSLFLSLGKISSARKYLERSKSYSQKSPLKFWIANNLVLEGKICFEINQYQEVDELLDQSEKYFLKMKNHKKLADIYSDKIDLYIETENLPEIYKIKNKYKEFPKTLTHLAKEKILLSKLKLQLVFPDEKIFCEEDIMKEEVSFINRFEYYANIARFYRYVFKSKEKEAAFCSKAKEVYNEIIKKAPDDFRESLKSKKTYCRFLKEFDNSYQT